MGVAVLTSLSLDATDIERTYRFYAAIGVELRWKSLANKERCLLIDAGGVTLEFCTHDRYGKVPWATVGFQVDSVYHTMHALRQEGYSPFGTAGECPYHSAMYTDPDGHVVVLTVREQDAPGAAADGGA